MMPRTGRIVINVADAKGAGVSRVEIFVDGKKQCDTAPCIVDQVSSGSHEVKVLAQGYDAPPDRSVTVEARKDAQLDFSLTSSGASAKVGTGIKVAGSQPGVKLYIDGKEIGPLPQELHTLPPGDHKIRLAGTDRYTPIEKSVILAQDEVQDLGDQTLKVVKGKATIELDTPGAKVSIVSGNDRREFPTLPIAVDLDTSKSWALEASKAGFSDYHQAVTFDDGLAEKTFKIALDPKTYTTGAQAQAPAAAAPAPRVAAVAQANQGERGPHESSAPAGCRRRPGDRRRRSTGRRGASSFLNINSIPVASVILDGQARSGSTPKKGSLLGRAGARTVGAIRQRRPRGWKKEVTVTVETQGRLVRGRGQSLREE